jgi:hypothetical protein
MALPLPVMVPEVDAHGLGPTRIRRCSYRRVIDAGAASHKAYDVECLYPDRTMPIPLGNVESATPICNACCATGIFRADED